MYFVGTFQLLFSVVNRGHYSVPAFLPFHNFILNFNALAANPIVKALPVNAPGVYIQLLVYLIVFVQERKYLGEAHRDVNK